MRAEPRVAFFTDSYLEVNGVAHTARNLASFARRRGLPFLVVHAAPKTEAIIEGTVERLGLARSRVGFALDADLRFDLLLWRHLRRAIEAVRSFGAEAIHITGPSDIGQLGAYIAWRLKLPLVVSWHTNVHEYGGARLGKMLPFLPAGWRTGIADFATAQSLRVLLELYKRGRVLLSPNEELAELLRAGCGRPVVMMRRGVDTALFSPTRRERRDGVFTIGYVGRLTPEKNVRFLAELERRLLEAGEDDFRFLIVGTGSEREWLEANMTRAEFTGVLKGEALARKYASLDLFVFPSTTDTFGNVVLEAQASGVPAVVSAQGGPRFIIRDKVTGIVAPDARAFEEAVRSLKADREHHRAMREAARQLAEAASWDAVFEEVYRAYRMSLAPQGPAKEAASKPQLETTNAIQGFE
ncbi:MAG: glycosyltransferase [Blastocatellia bacterium]|nr:glycosyltransferase [Blastocatellia bacterium]